MSALRYILGPFAALFHLFGLAWGAVAEIVRPVLEICGFVHPQPQDVAGDIAEDAVDQVKAQGSTVDRKPAATWPLAEKLDAISKWSDWKLNGKAGKEPSLAGLTLRERMTLKQAKDIELQALILRYPAEIMSWLSGPSARLKPLTEAELAKRKPQIDAMTKASEEWRADLKKRMDADDISHAQSMAETAALLRETNALMVRSSALLGKYNLAGSRDVDVSEDYAPAPRFVA